jgi:hypothetical protein
MLLELTFESLESGEFKALFLLLGQEPSYEVNYGLMNNRFAQPESR